MKSSIKVHGVTVVPKTLRKSEMSRISEQYHNTLFRCGICNLMNTKMKDGYEVRCYYGRRNAVMGICQACAEAIEETASGSGMTRDCRKSK